MLWTLDDKSFSLGISTSHFALLPAFSTKHIIETILPGLLINFINHSLSIRYSNSTWNTFFFNSILAHVEIPVKVDLTNSNLKMLQHVTPGTYSIHPRLSTLSKTYTFQDLHFTSYWCSTVYLHMYIQKYTQDNNTHISKCLLCPENVSMQQKF